MLPLGLALLLGCGNASAQAWPSKPVKFVAPFPPGGPVDLLARLIGQKISEKSGKLRAIAVTSGQRSSAAPEIPTIAEAGLTGFGVSSWYAIMAPAKTPPAMVAALADEVRRIVALPDVRQTLAVQGLAPVAMAPAEFAAHIRRETATSAAIIRDANIKAE